MSFKKSEPANNQIAGSSSKTALNSSYSQNSDSSRQAPQRKKPVTGRKDRNSTKSEPIAAPTYNKWQLQDTAAAILSKNQVKLPRIAACHRMLIPEDENKGTEKLVSIYETMDKRRFTGGLIQCGSLWVCAVCGAKITEKRRGELEKGVQSANEQDVTILLATYTVQHNYKDELKPLLSSLRNARRRVKSGRAYKDIKNEFSIICSVEELEITRPERLAPPHP